jgi:hypothetical protein
MAGERPRFTSNQIGNNPGYEAAIRREVPETFFRQAADIIKSRKPTDPRLKNLDVLAMAKVLIVEDDKSWSRNHSMLAVEAGHEVVAAASAEDAKKVLEANGIDFIITDGLEDQWTQVHDLAKEKGIRTMVVSSSLSVEREAAKREVEFVDKLDNDLFEKLTDTFGSI